MAAELPPELAIDASSVIEPEAMLSCREVTKHGVKSTKWLIHWKNKPVEEATWEKTADIKSQFPNFCLEDKADIKSQFPSWPMNKEKSMRSPRYLKSTLEGLKVIEVGECDELALEK